MGAPVLLFCFLLRDSTAKPGAPIDPDPCSPYACHLDWEVATNSLPRAHGLLASSSSWYALKYPSPRLDERPCNQGM